MKTLDNMKYSIIYAFIRPEISERVSLGLIFVDGDKVDMRYRPCRASTLRLQNRARPACSEITFTRQPKTIGEKFKDQS